MSNVDVAHICIPFSDDFSNLVRKYKKFAKLVIVHSSVPVGTCDKLGVVHSPVVGKHPNMEEGIRTFTKYFGGVNSKEAAKIFSKLGIKTEFYKEAKITEAMKLMSTTYYGLNIMIEKEIYAWCKKKHLPFDLVYTLNNIDYNRGYTLLGNPEFVRSNLKHVKGKIGGHCVINNLNLLKDFWLGDLLKKQNDKY